MRKVNKIIVHCSASDLKKDDSLGAIKHLHTFPKSEKINWGKYKTRGRAWSDVGYHYFIDKCGRIAVGRPLKRIGAHCRGHNKDSVGICVSGENLFNNEQFRALRELIDILCKAFGLRRDDVYPHNYFDKSKTCPNFEINHSLVKM